MRLARSPLGSDGGAGFGWQNRTTVKGGVQLRAGEGWTWRAGYSYGSQPIPDSEAAVGANPLEVPGLQAIELKMDQWDFELSWSFGIKK